MFLILYSVVYFLTIRFIFYILPVLLGGLLGWVTVPLCRVLETKLSAPRKRAALLTAVGSYVLLLVALVLLLTKLVQELTAFVSSGKYFRYDALAPYVRAFFENAAAKLPQWLSDAQKNFSGNMGAVLPAVQGTLRTVLFLPAVFLTLILTPIFAYLTILYRSKLFGFFKNLIGDKNADNLLKSFKSNSSAGFITTYILIYTITFAESFVILYLLRMEYPLITALIVTVSDIFPVLGPGSVLIPLAVYRLLCGSAAQALGLFVGWIILSVIRQIIEPKLLSEMTRTPPAVMLFAVYCSFISRNFWLIPYIGIFFTLLHTLQKAEILPQSQKINLN